VQDAGPVFEHPEATGDWKMVRGTTEELLNAVADAREAKPSARAPIIWVGCMSAAAGELTD
jgi:hypothetical protein